MLAREAGEVDDFLGEGHPAAPPEEAVTRIFDRLLGTPISTAIPIRFAQSEASSKPHGLSFILLLKEVKSIRKKSFRNLLRLSRIRLSRVAYNSE
jgi:hypothetical protein